MGAESLPASPGWPTSTPRRSGHDQVRQARDVTRQHGRTFALACRVLPREAREDVYRLYEVFRTLDDLVDEGRPEAFERIEAVIAWSRQGEADTPETRTLAALDARSPLPRAALEDFGHGMLSDLENRPVQDDADLERYCYEVAGTVGLVLAARLGAGPDADAAAIALGRAMQLTNILRDIDEDQAAGRHYLPVSPETLMPGGRRTVLVNYIARADALYDEGLTGLAHLRAGRRGVWVAAVLYREILRQIERDGYGATAGRAVVSRRRKLAAILRSGASGRVRTPVFRRYRPRGDHGPDRPLERALH